MADVEFRVTAAPYHLKFYTKLLLTMKRVETDDKTYGTTYQLLRVRVRVFCRVRVRVSVSVGCIMDGSFLMDKGMSKLKMFISRHIVLN